jgi:hypothetical protein
VIASGTLSVGDGAIGGQYCHAEPQRSISTPILKCVLTTTLRVYCYESVKDVRKYRDRPFAAAQGDTARHLRPMHIGDPLLHSPNALPRTLTESLRPLSYEHLWVLNASLGLHTPLFDGGEKSCMVAFGLVCVHLGE